MKKHIILGGALAIALLIGITFEEGITEGIAGTGKAAHVDVAIFHFYGGNSAPDEIKGVDIISQLHGKAQFLTITHTTGVKDQDVLMVSSDILREGDSSEDFGVDCQIILHVAQGENVTTLGKCEVFYYDAAHKKEVEAKIMMKPTLLKSSDWQLVAWDPVSHIGIYADEEIGQE
jgi:hypothetical protein